ncbi:MAG: ATP-binding cassette domain-containing protein [bacterium]
MIELENVKKFYGDFQALAGISFNISKGEIVGFLGPNGAGKTTTMRIISNYFPATSGSVRIKGLSPEDGRKYIGYMPESNPLYPDLFVEDYLRYVLGLRNMRDRGKIKNVVEKCGLKNMMSKKIGELSKGLKQRVGLAASIVHDPEILILDEPTIGLDPNQVVEIRALIKDLGREKTVIISTHILSEAEALSTRVIIVNKGGIVLDSPADRVDEHFSPQVTVEFAEMPDDFGKIEKINGVEKIERNGNVLKVLYKSSVDVRVGIFNLCAGEKWKVLEIFRERVGLESVFKSLTSEK